jgi:ABC-type antimicrobial peptide transport system, permease component
MYDKSSEHYDAKTDNDTINHDIFMRAVNAIKQCPEVESYGVASGWFSVPNSTNYRGNSISCDTAHHTTQIYGMCHEAGGDLMKAYKFKDAITGKTMEYNNKISTKQAVYISEQLAKDIFGTTNVIGKSLHFEGDPTTLKVAGVFKEVNTKTHTTPFAGLTLCDQTLKDCGYTNAVICFRLKEGTDAIKFEEKFKHHIAPRFEVGNFINLSLISMKHIKKDFMENDGINNQCRLQIMMSGFFLICVFLGMVGTFWIRCNNRRGEIGVMKAIGYSTNRITTQFVTEAFVIVTIAFIVSIILMLNIAYMQDFFKIDPVHINYPYLSFHPIKMFAVVSAITYIIMIFISLLGTYIPVRRATKALPADALKEE